MGRKLDIVTVVCRRDLHKMVLQARSVRLFFDERERGQVLVICNEPLERLSAKELQPIADELPGIVFIQAKDLLPMRGRGLLDGTRVAEKSNPGWFTQQVLKIAVGRSVQSEFYLILDAKNHFVRPASARTFIGDDGRALASIGPVKRMQKEFNRVWRTSHAYLGLDPDLCPSDSITPVTPFVAPRKLVCDLIDHVEAQEGTDFARAMLSRMPDLYEFLLLQAFVVYRHGSLHDLYRDDSPPRFTTLVRTSLAHCAGFDGAMERAEGERTVVFAIHHWADPLLSLQQKRRIGDYWQRQGLVESGREAFSLMGWDSGA